MWYWIVAGLAALSFGTGLGNYVSALIYRVNGTWSSAYVDGYGEPVTAIFGPGIPLPAWMPRPPGAVIITASNSFTGLQRRQFAKLDIVTRKSTAELERFYLDRLHAAGFVVAKRDAELVDPRLAKFFGIDATIEFTHPREDWRLSLNIYSPSGLILPSRTVGLAWWGWPFEKPPVPRQQ